VRPVYSERFIAHAGLGYSNLYIVPAGRRAILRQLVGSNPGTAEGLVIVELLNRNTYFFRLPAGGSAASPQLMVVLYALEGARLYHTDAGMVSVLSGHLLHEDP